MVKTISVEIEAPKYQIGQKVNIFVDGWNNPAKVLSQTGRFTMTRLGPTCGDFYCASWEYRVEMDDSKESVWLQEELVLPWLDITPSDKSES